MNAKIKLISSNVGICKFEKKEKQPADEENMELK